MANIFNTLLATTVANAQEERRRQSEQAHFAQAQMSDTISQNLALQRHYEQVQREQAERIGAASQMTGDKISWSYANPDLENFGQIGALSERADMQKQQIGAQIQAQKLAEMLQGKENVANIGAGAKVKSSEIEAGGRTGAAETAAEAAKYRADEIANAMRYSADKRAQLMANRPALTAFWNEKKYWDIGKGGQAATNLNTAAQHLERLLDAIHNLKNQGAIHWNQATNAYEYERGDPRIIHYMNISHVMTREIGNYLNASGALTDTEKASTHKLTDENLPMEAQEATAFDLWNMANDKKEGLMHQRDHMFEQPDQYQFWSPGAIGAGNRMGVKMDQSGGNGPPPATPPAKTQGAKQPGEITAPDLGGVDASMPTPEQIAAELAKRAAARGGQ